MGGCGYLVLEASIVICWKNTLGPWERMLENKEVQEWQRTCEKFLGKTVFRSWAALRTKELAV